MTDDYHTPDWILDLLADELAADAVIDPACGSGRFLDHVEDGGDTDR